MFSPKSCRKLIVACLAAGIPGSALTAHAFLWNSNLERRSPAIVVGSEEPTVEEVLDAQGEVPPPEADHMELMSVRVKPVPIAKPVPKPAPKPQPKPKPPVVKPPVVKPPVGTPPVVTPPVVKPPITKPS